MDDTNNNGTQIAIEKLKHEVADVKSQLKNAEKVLSELSLEEDPNFDQVAEQKDPSDSKEKQDPQDPPQK